MPDKKHKYLMARILDGQPDRYQQFLSFLAAGASITSAANAIGVSANAILVPYHRGKERSASKFEKKFYRDISKVLGKIRGITESELRISDPKFWLEKGPGRILGDEYSSKEDQIKITPGEVIAALIALHDSGVSIDNLITTGQINSLGFNNGAAPQSANALLVAPGIPTINQNAAAPFLLHDDSDTTDIHTSDISIVDMQVQVDEDTVGDDMEGGRYGDGCSGAMESPHAMDLNSVPNKARNFSNIEDLNLGTNPDQDIPSDLPANDISSNPTSTDIDTSSKRITSRVTQELPRKNPSKARSESAKVLSSKTNEEWELDKLKKVKSTYDHLPTSLRTFLGEDNEG